MALRSGAMRICESAISASAPWFLPPSRETTIPAHINRHLFAGGVDADDTGVSTADDAEAMAATAKSTLAGSNGVRDAGADAPPRAHVPPPLPATVVAADAVAAAAAALPPPLLLPAVVDEPA